MGRELLLSATGALVSGAASSQQSTDSSNKIIQVGEV